MKIHLLKRSCFNMQAILKCMIGALQKITTTRYLLAWIYLYPTVDKIPAVEPIRSAPNGWTIISALAPIATPPAKVAFWMWTCCTKKLKYLTSLVSLASTSKRNRQYACKSVHNANETEVVEALPPNHIVFAHCVFGCSTFSMSYRKQVSGNWLQASFTIPLGRSLSVCLLRPWKFTNPSYLHISLCRVGTVDVVFNLEGFREHSHVKGLSNADRRLFPAVKSFFIVSSQQRWAFFLLILCFQFEWNLALFAAILTIKKALLSKLKCTLL